jgi:hypothetical protein
MRGAGLYTFVAFYGATLLYDLHDHAGSFLTLSFFSFDALSALRMHQRVRHYLQGDLRHGSQRMLRPRRFFGGCSVRWNLGLALDWL